MEILIQVAQFVLSLSLLIFIHELGHLFFARMFGIRVDKFYIFFDFWGVKLFKFKIGQTEFGMGWFPVGGYCKIAGMIDESMDTEFLKSDPQPWEFRSKPAWQRLLVMTGGVVMNIVLATVIYIGMSYHWGERYIANEDLKYGYAFSPLGHEAGFEDGDKVLMVGGREIEDASDILPAIVLDNLPPVDVARGDEQLTVNIPSALMPRILADTLVFMRPLIPDDDPDFLTVRTREYTFLQSIPQGFRRAGDEVAAYWQNLKLLVKPETGAYKSVGGFLAIGNMFAPAWDWYRFWSITALLSVILAVMNILPIPALDGGHVMFLLYEVVTRRKPGDKFLEHAQVAGLIIVLALLLFATWNDIYRFFIR